MVEYSAIVGRLVTKITFCEAYFAFNSATIWAMRSLVKDESKCLDEILMSSEFERTELINILFEMQLEGLIEERIGDGYVLKKR